MTLADLFTSQLIDPFRIALTAGLLFTMQRTRANTGVWVPLLCGAIFIAVLIPSTSQINESLSIALQIASGFVANLIWLGALSAIWALSQRIRQKS